MYKFPDREVRWGIIGCGDVTEVKSGPAFNRIKNSKLVAVMRRDAAKAEDYARRHGVPFWFNDATALIDHPEVNAIYIATPPDSHAHYTLMAARAGKPVYVEKPMARSFQECQQMISACQEADIPLFTAYYRRQLPPFLKVKELIASGAIGEVRFVNIRLYQAPKPAILAAIVEGRPENWRVNPEVAGGGYFYDLASHQLDFMDDLLGPIKNASGFHGNQAGLYAAEDIVAGSFIFEKGVLGTGIWCFSVAEKAAFEETEIIGSTGKITFSFFSSAPVVLEKDQRKEVFSFEMPRHVQQPLIETVVADLLGRGKCSSTGETASRTNAVMEQIVRKN
ncbi:MAG: Gfo/Idh/MocA family oxidoreductase [Bacteroidia bacterium]|nr:Gfo/Idh/MocA family oxidoreductase [Bacteroidia bacterium]